VSDEDRSVDRVLKEEADEADRLLSPDPHDDRTQTFSHLGLSRMRMSWSTEDAEAMAGLHQVIERRMLERFSDAYRIMNDLYEIVREPHIQEGGEIATDVHGFTVWARTESGGYVEDYTKLGSKEVKDFLFRITTRLFEWEQEAASLWGDAMFAKAVWEQTLAEGYNDSRSNGAKTVEDRTQAARLASREDRLFGIFASLMSRKAEALVRSLSLLSQRLKDVLSS
jgi:hypothetical protein